MTADQMTPEQRRDFCKQEADNWLAKNQKRAGEQVGARVCIGCLNKIYGENCGGKIFGEYCAAKITSRHR